MRDVTKPEVLERFRGEWEKYLQQLEAAPADDLGADLDAEILGTMSDDQKAKLVDMRASSRRRARRTSITALLLVHARGGFGGHARRCVGPRHVPRTR